MTTTQGTKLLDQYSVTDLQRLYSLSLATPEKAESVTAERDLIVYRNKSITLSLTNGTISKYRDLIIFGELIIKSAKEELPRGRLEARNIIQPGHLDITHIELSAKYHTIFHGLASFQQELLHRLNKSTTSQASSTTTEQKQ